jgi:hypothetical protein
MVPNQGKKLKPLPQFEARLEFCLQAQTSQKIGREQRASVQKKQFSCRFPGDDALSH